MTEFEQICIRNQTQAALAERILREMDIGPGGHDWIHRASALRWLQDFQKRNGEVIENNWEPT